MELKIMEWDHPLSYFQWSASLWFSSEFRKFCTDLQIQNNYLFNHVPFPTCLCNESPNTSLTLSPSPQFIPCSVLLGPLSTLIAYYPSQARSTSCCQTFPPFLTSLSAAYHWNLISKPFSFSGLPAESLTALCFSRPHFIPLLPSISPYFLCCVPFYISSTSPRFSKFFL